MSDWFCYGCDENIGDKEYCPYCGMHRSGETPMISKESNRIQGGNGQKKQTQKQGPSYPFSEEERLATGLYPKDEGYKISLISRVLEKNH